MGSDPSPPRRTHVRATELLGYARLRRTDRLEQARLLWAGCMARRLWPGFGLDLAGRVPPADLRGMVISGPWIGWCGLTRCCVAGVMRSDTYSDRDSCPPTGAMLPGRCRWPPLPMIAAARHATLESSTARMACDAVRRGTGGASGVRGAPAALARRRCAGRVGP